LMIKPDLKATAGVFAFHLKAAAMPLNN
jgi:hypothetical protein